MLQIYSSNDLAQLKELLCLALKNAPLQDPLAQEQILVQSPGMAQWLKLELAKSMGIAANVEFPLPASFIWSMFTKTIDDVPKESPFNKEPMSWRLMQLLPSLLNLPEFAPLAGYLGQGDSDAAPICQLRLWQLCQEIADLFDQYLVYRPEWITAWEAGAGLECDPKLREQNGQAWQPILWRELVTETAASSNSGYHRANLYESFIEALQLRGDLALPPRLFIFGISALPNGYLHALNALGTKMEIALFLHNPCRYYWGDLRDPKLSLRHKQGQLTSAEGNSLLASMGKLGRDYLDALAELGVNETPLFSDELPPQNLLQVLQSDILELRERGDGADREPKWRLDPSDHSLQVHACHGPVRELEVLHDQLLALFAQDPTLTPKDIVVMLPDVNRYSPYIEAVFGSKAMIPFSISDRSLVAENPLLNSFLKLLRLPLSRFGATELLALLEIPAMARRFGIAAEDFPLLRRLVQESGIRWGLGGDHATRFDLPAQPSHSWLFGLHRLLLGFAMGEGELIQDTLPYAEVEGQQGVVLGRMAAFVERLAAWLPRLEESATLPEWTARIHQLLADFYQTNPDEEELLQRVRDLCTKWQDRLDECAFEQPLSPELVRNYLTRHLEESGGSPRFLAGQLNFCTLMPMRTIPFRYVCLLGMNDGLYPRTVAPLGFDLISKATRRGDRSRRDDDRYLFLEALLSARDGLYISYQGFSEVDNRERVPSVLLAELLDYCRQGVYLRGDEANDLAAQEAGLIGHLVQNHPLTPYSRDYFYPNAESRLFSYAQEWLPLLHVAPKPKQSELEPLPPPEQTSELELSELVRFARAPVAHFFNRRLKVFFEPLEVELDEQEPFALDPLQRYQIKAQMVDDLLHQRELDPERYQQSGQLPIAGFGARCFADLKPKAEAVAIPLLAQRGEAERIEVDIKLPQGELRGWLRLEGGHLLRHKSGKMNGKDFVGYWIEHLALQAMGYPRTTHLFDEEGGFYFEPLPRDVAIDLLSAWVSDWQSGLCRPVALFPKSALAYAQSWQKDGDQYQALAAARKKFHDSYNGIPGEESDNYNARIFSDLSGDTLDEFAALTLRHYLPLLSHLQERN